MCSRCRQYNSWKDTFGQTVDRFHSPLPQNTSPVKIAILDTGLDTAHTDIANALDRIRMYDSVGDKFKRNVPITDLKGHGTHITGLILEYAIDAQLYVANVTKEGKADRDLIAKVRC